MSDLAQIKSSRSGENGSSLERYSLDIFHGAARVGFEGLKSGPVQLPELVLEVRALPVPFDLGTSLASRFPCLFIICFKIYWNIPQHKHIYI